MICHTCRVPASGQCTSCHRFYCPDHGDVTCSACRAEGAPAQPATSPPVGGGRASRRRPAPAVRHCFKCGQPAAVACDKCGNPFCPRHGQGEPTWSFTRRMVCSKCLAVRFAVMLLVGLLVGIVVLACMTFKPSGQ